MNWRVQDGKRIDWKAERERIDLAAAATRLLGPPPGRRGERSTRKLWWSCPYHEDPNPSFCVEAGKPWWKCYGCGERGDAATLAMKVLSVSFPEAVAYLTGGPAPAGKPGSGPKSPTRARPKPAEPSGLDPEAATRLVEESAARLWSPEGAEALAYLTGPRRLSLETIRTARLGWTPEAQARTKDGRPYSVRGIVIPWFSGTTPALVKVRRAEGLKPKYVELHRHPARLSGLYPGPAAVRPGRPLVITEGEFEALILGQVLGDRAAVVTLGSASARPGPGILGAMLTASRWYVATDADPAGDRSAAGWPGSARRVRPPGPHKDWTEAAAAGVNLIRWWSDVLAGAGRPELYTWEELVGWRWGPGRGDPEPGIILDWPEPNRLAVILAALADNPEARAEREAMRMEAVGETP